MEYYDNGLPVRPLYKAELSGFKNDTGFIPFSNQELTNDYIQKQINSKKPQYILAVDLSPQQRMEISLQYGKMELLSYIVSPDYSEFWLIFKDYYIVAKGLTKVFKKAMKEGTLSCVLSCGSEPLLLPFSFGKV